MPKALLTRIAARILNTPLMITPQKLETILGVLGPRIGLEGFQSAPLAVTDFSRSARYREYTGDGIGLIPVMGPLAYNLSFEEAACSDIVSYHDVRNMFREALSDPLVSSILFAFDSPGGEVSGVFDLADEIYQARGVKPIYAIADESTFSAAYALASAAQTIFIPRTGQVGSIGVIAMPFDQSQFDAKAGVKFYPIFAGAKKNDLNPHFPISKEAQERLQATVDEDYRIFTELVARNRGLSVEAVRATEADIFQGEAAIGAGLADKIMNFHQAVAFIESQSRDGGKAMKIFGFGTRVKPDATAPDGGKPEGQLPEEVVDLQAVLEQARDEGRQQGKLEMEAKVFAAGANERARSLAILDRCAAVASQLTNPLGLAAELIGGELSAEAASERILSAVADKSASESGEVVSTVTPTGSGEQNPLIADAKKRAEAAQKKGA